MKKLLFPIILALTGLSILIGLGTWQLKRHYWKQTILNEISDGIKSEPADYLQWYSGSERSNIQQFRKFSIKGRQESSNTVYVHSLHKGRSGFLVMVPVRLAPGHALFINRGFIPADMKREKTAFSAGEEITVEGFLRLPENRSLFTPAPDVEKRIWYSIDPESMRGELSLQAVETRYYIEQSGLNSKENWPRTRTLDEIMNGIPNRHLEYAFTWYGLALALVGVFAAFVWSTINRD